MPALAGEMALPSAIASWALRERPARIAAQRRQIAIGFGAGGILEAEVDRSAQSLERSILVLDHEQELDIREARAYLLVSCARSGLVSADRACPSST
jgi:hypothetical protein